MRKLHILFCALSILVMSIPLSGQGIKGKVVDMNGDPVSYASIFIKELTRGTTSNSLGLFSLPLPSGEYTIFFRSLGYTEVVKRISLEEDMLALDVVMPPQTYMIPEVRVSASGEDPAYRIMRKAIGLANYHLNQVSTYDAEIYIKGTAFFHKLPRAIAKRIEVGDIKVEENRAYMLESLNEVTYRAPDKYDMRIIASQNTIPGYVESVNPMDYINASLYQPQIESFVSPLARNAFFYYKFSFEGSFLQGTHMIDKIRVTPKRKSQQLCSGFLYIVEDLWCLHSSDLVVNTIAGELLLQQQYANVIVDAWLPVSHKLDLDVEFAGVQADVTYVSSLKYESTILNPNLPRSYFEPINKPLDMPPEKEPSEEQQKIQEILEKDEISDRDMARLNRLMEKETEAADPDTNKLEVEGTKFSVAPNAVINDSLFWSELRPVPLTLEEKTTLAVRDSIYGFSSEQSNTVSDSSKTPRRRTYRTRDYIIGRTFQSADRKLKIIYGGIVDFSMLSFSAVDGWVYGQDIGFDYRPNLDVAYRGNLKAGYALARKAPDIAWNSDILYAPKIRGKLALKINYRSLDFNQENGVPVFTNTVYSLFLKENYSRQFELISGQLEHRMDLATGLVFYATLDLQQRKELVNNSDFSLFYRSSKVYDPNHPQDMAQDLHVFDDSRLLAAQVRIEYTHEYYYRLRNGRKRYFKSDYPTIYSVYRHAFPAQTTDWADYNLLIGGLRHERDVGLLSTLEYKVEGGYFFRSDNMHFSDYFHTKAAPLPVDMMGFEESFLMLEHYRASTNEYFIQAHARLTSPYIALKMLPWFSERLWNESLSVAYLNTPGVPHHIQAGYSLNEIGFLVDIGIYVSIEDWQYHGTALRFNLRF